MAKSRHYYIRRSHRYLGLLLGIQFLLWTIGGLYFSWTNMDEVHGDHLRRPAPLLPAGLALVSPAEVLVNLPFRSDSIHSLQLLPVLGQPHYALQVYSGGKLRPVLADALSGRARAAINREEAIAIASAQFNGVPKLRAATLIATTDGHHEYREKPLPAWALSFDHPSRTTVYVSANIGRVESFRNDSWRIFDWLWMLHTMDYESRDNINNWLLRIFSVFGLVTVLSGFVLYAVSSRGWSRKKQRAAHKAG